MNREPRRPRASTVLLLLACALALVPASSSTGLITGPSPAELTAELPAAGARRALLEAYAPVVLLSPDERALPARTEWYLAQAELLPGRRGAGAGRAWAEDARLRPHRAALGGSPDPAEWTTYGHVYRAEDGGLLLQYWFFYPFNRFHRLGDHDADWEHVTVHVGPDGRPRGAWYARHIVNAPGVWFPWSALVREGSHPVVLAAAGSHASYANRREVPWFESTCSTTDPAQAAGEGCRVWRTWSATTGGIEDLGSRDEPAVEYLLWPGRWGAKGGIADDGAGPPGPAFQDGWCSHGAPGCS